MAKYEIAFTAEQDADLKLAVGARKLGPMMATDVEPATAEEVAEFLKGEARSVVQSYLSRKADVERSAAVQTELVTKAWIDPPPAPKVEEAPAVPAAE